MKKVSLLLSIIFMLTAISACGNKEQGNGDIKNGEQESELFDFDGREFIVESEWIFEDFCPDEGQTLDLDIARAWWKQTEKDLNCVIVPVKSNPAPAIPASVASGTKRCDFMYIPAYDMYSLAKAGYLANLDELENIDPLDEKRWSQNYGREMYTFKGDTYAVKSNSYTGAAGGISGGMLVFNERLIEEFNAPDPYELLENKQWTFETFKNLLPNVSDTTEDRKIYGLFSMIDDLLPKSAVFANGGKVAVEQGGKLVFGFTQPEALSAIEWAKSIIEDKDIYKKVDYNKGDFAKGGSTFYLSQAWVNTIMVDAYKEFSTIMNDIVFSWIHFPYGPSAEYGETMAAWEQSTIQEWTIPISCDDEEESAYVLSYWMDPAHNDPAGFAQKTEEFNNRQRSQYFFSDKSYEQFIKNDVNKILDYPLGLEPLRNQINETLGNAAKGSKSVIEALSSIETKVNTLLDEEYNNG